MRPMPEEFTDPQRPHHREAHVRTPTGELDHEEKIHRQQTHIRVLSIVLVLVLLMLAYAAVFDLDTAPEWIVFGAIVLTALGAIIAVQSR